MIKIGDRVVIKIARPASWSAWAPPAFNGRRGTVEEHRPDDWLVRFDTPVPNPNGGPAIASFGFDSEDLTGSEEK